MLRVPCVLLCKNCAGCGVDRVCSPEPGLAQVKAWFELNRVRVDIRPRQRVLLYRSAATRSRSRMGRDLSIAGQRNGNFCNTNSNKSRALDPACDEHEA